MEEQGNGRKYFVSITFQNKYVCTYPRRLKAGVADRHPLLYNLALKNQVFNPKFFSKTLKKKFHFCIKQLFSAKM